MAVVKVKPGGQVTVTTAGTRVQLSAVATRVTSVTIQALPANTGVIYVGDDSVDSTHTVAILAASQSTVISGDLDGFGTQELLLSDIYLDSSVSGEKIAFSYFVRG